MAYGLSTSKGYLTADQIIAMLDESIEIQAAYAQNVRNFVREGVRYSNHDFDVLSAAFGCALRNETQTPEYARTWVNKMFAEARARIEAGQ